MRGRARPISKPTPPIPPDDPDAHREPLRGGDPHFAEALASAKLNYSKRWAELSLAKLFVGSLEFAIVMAAWLAVAHAVDDASDVARSAIFTGAIALPLVAIVRAFFRAGTTVMDLRCARAEAVSIAELFAHFDRFRPMLALELIFSPHLLFVLIGVPLALGGSSSGASLCIGIALLAKLSALYAEIAGGHFAYFFVVDEQAAPLDALRRASQLSTPSRDSLRLFGVRIVGAALLGATFCVVGAVLARAFAGVAYAAIYLARTRPNGARSSA